MAARLPNLTPATAGYVDPKLGVFGGVATATNNLNTDVNNRISNRNGLQLLIFHFTAVVGTDIWTSNIRNIVAVAWQPEDAADDPVGVVLTTQATGVIEFSSPGGTDAGWLWLLVGGAANRGP